MLTAILGAIFGVLATVVLSLLSAVPADVDRRDRQIGERDQELEAWIVGHHRGLKQRFQELEQQANANGVGRGGTIPAGQVAVKTLLLYDYREELRRANSFALDLEVAERWPHRLYRTVRRQPLPRLRTPDKSQPIVDYWLQDTAGNALTWGVEDIIREERLDGREAPVALAA
jgi:hypothetical protein